MKETHEALRRGVREVCARFPNEYWRELDAERRYPQEFVAAMTEAGYLAALVPEEYGGMGLDLSAACAILEEVNRSGANAGPAHAQMYTMGTLLRHGSERQKEEYLPKIASGELRLQAFAVTEPEAGTDTTSITTTATREGDHYVVSGRKIYISRVEQSDLMILLARTTPAGKVEKRSRGLSVFLVDLREAVGGGLSVRPRRVMMNNATNELVFKGLRVPAENLVGEEGEGFRYILDGMNAERVLIAAECIGDGRFFIEKATQRAKEREVFGGPIGQNQGVQFPIARAYAHVEAASLMVAKAAALFDRGEPCGAEANLAKLLAADASWEAANAAVQTFGGYGFDAEYGVERKFRETRLYQVAPISTNLILAHLAEHVLGLPEVLLSVLPLEGITVVSLEQAVAAPFATRQLADLGARVVKVERPGKGDFARSYDATVKGLSSHFVWLNRSKESLTLDLKKEGAHQVLRRLLERADVFVQNLAPGAAGRLGFGAEELRERYPRLVVCGVSGYGSSGPYRDKKAYDLLVQCEAGLVSVTGTPETPSKAGIAVADIAAGMHAYSAILAALLRRERTGEGAAIEVSLFEALAEWMGFPAYYTLYGEGQPPRSGARHASIAPYGPFACGDGETVFFGIQNDREWQKFCDSVLGRPEMARDELFESNSRRVENREVLEGEIEEAFESLTAEEAVARLDGAGIANARLRSVQSFLDHPQLEARDRWREVGSPEGPLRALLPPAAISGAEPVMGPIPAVGEHTATILSELGYDERSVAELRREEAV